MGGVAAIHILPHMLTHVGRDVYLSHASHPKSYSEVSALPNFLCSPVFIDPRPFAYITMHVNLNGTF